MPVRFEHAYDRVADRLAGYVEEMADKLVNAMTADGHAPFAVPLTRAEQEAYYVEKYRDFVYTPEGLPNEQGRDALLEAFGAEAFATIVRLVLREQQRSDALATAPPVDESPLSYPVTREQAGIPAPTAPPQEESSAY